MDTKTKRKRPGELGRLRFVLSVIFTIRDFYGSQYARKSCGTVTLRFAATLRRVLHQQKHNPESVKLVR